MKPPFVPFGRMSTALCIASVVFSALACAATNGVVAGSGYYQNTLVCIDQNSNGRCDLGEQSWLGKMRLAFK
jgi:hypothetical protein